MAHTSLKPGKEGIGLLFQNGIANCQSSLKSGPKATAPGGRRTWQAPSESQVAPHALHCSAGWPEPGTEGATWKGQAEEELGQTSALRVPG